MSDTQLLLFEIYQSVDEYNNLVANLQTIIHDDEFDDITAVYNHIRGLIHTVILSPGLTENNFQDLQQLTGDLRANYQQIAELYDQQQLN